MEYISKLDINDSFLDVADKDIAEANAHIEDLANRRGVEIKIPIPHILKRLAICFACYSCCLNAVGTDPTTSFDGGSREDIYSQKLEFYKQEIKDIESKLTDADFTGKKAGRTCISLWRA